MRSLNNPGNYSVLISPLDWGLGHATRCLPLIAYLLEKNCRVSVAGEGAPIALIQRAYPDINFIPLKGYRIRYPRKGIFFVPALILQVPKMINSIIKEHRWLVHNQKKYKWDLIISDNRYGLYSHDIKSIFITHQPKIITGLGQYMDSIAARILKIMIERFDQCWIPDVAGVYGIAGRLANGNRLPHNSTYIGPLSRLESNSDQTNNHILVLLSGPEPQRSILEELLIKQLKDCDEKIEFVRGLPSTDQSKEPTHNINFSNHLNTRQLSHCMSNAKMVICRSGYSTIMDLLKLNKKALLIPTPGQSEQIYLAKRLSKIGWFMMQQQEELNVKQAITYTLKTFTERPIFDFEGYKQAFKELGIQ